MITSVKNHLFGDCESVASGRVNSCASCDTPEHSLAAFPDGKVPPWQAPSPEEKLRDYAQFFEIARELGGANVKLAFVAQPRQRLLVKPRCR